MCVTSLLCGPQADLWPFYGFLCKRFSLESFIWRESRPTLLTVEYSSGNLLSHTLRTMTTMSEKTHEIKLSFLESRSAKATSTTEGMSKVGLT